ncbi:c-type cytochrome [Thiohalobacter sp.]|uniref:c-type cytochrome n=1 Tax=Thiohalobacter sp. TaxID=2025948 RepID=UPI00260F56EB|nr:cytochrome c [Thiohalobacter sp.]
MIRNSLVALPILLLAAGPGQADPRAGRALHDQHCLKCHDTAVYTRPDRRVKDLAALRKQVQRCELSLGLTWFDQDIDKVVDYLNSNFYRFQ